MLLHSIPNPIVPFRSIATLAFSQRTFSAVCFTYPCEVFTPLELCHPSTFRFSIYVYYS
jgi:hypothetical protein